MPADGDGARGAPPVAAAGETRGGESRAGETCQRANAKSLVDCPFLGTAPGDCGRWGGCQTVLAGGRRSREASGKPPSITAHGGRCRASACGTAGWSASAPGAPPRRAARPRLTEGSGQNGDHVELGMNSVLPATLMLDWWDARLRVAGSLKLGWVTASLVLANNRPSTLPPRRGTRPSGQLPQSGHQRGHGVKYRLYGAAVEQLTAFSGGGRFAGRPGGIAADLLASPADSSDRSCTAGRCVVFHRGGVSPLMRVRRVS